MKFDMADINRRFRIKEEEIRRLAEELEKRDREIVKLKAEIEQMKGG